MPNRGHQQYCLLQHRISDYVFGSHQMTALRVMVAFSVIGIFGCVSIDGVRILNRAAYSTDGYAKEAIFTDLNNRAMKTLTCNKISRVLIESGRNPTTSDFLHGFTRFNRVEYWPETWKFIGCRKYTEYRLKLFYDEKNTEGTRYSYQYITAPECSNNHSKFDAKCTQDIMYLEHISFLKQHHISNKSITVYEQEKVRGIKEHMELIQKEIDFRFQDELVLLVKRSFTEDSFNGLFQMGRQ